MKHPTGAVLRLAAILAAGALVAGACSYDDTPLPEPSAADEVTSAAQSECTTDESTLASEPPDDVAGPTVQQIRDRGLLKVGVSADTFLMASTNPETGRIEGFDIDVVRAIGQAIFGSSFSMGRDVQLRVITAADRIPLLGAAGETGELDLVVRNFTINCDRKEDIAFSAEYYHASQKVLVRSDQADGDESNGEYTGPESLAGQDVCAPNGSTSLDNIRELVPDANAVPAGNHTGCLILFQRGEVDAITGDDTVLAGLAAQDPYAVVPEQEPLSDEPYGVGINQDSTDLVAFVNAALERMESGGAWDRAYDRWLRPYLGDPTPFTPRYTS